MSESEMFNTEKNPSLFIMNMKSPSLASSFRFRRSTVNMTSNLNQSKETINLKSLIFSEKKEYEYQKLLDQKVNETKSLRKEIEFYKRKLETYISEPLQNYAREQENSELEREFESFFMESNGRINREIENAHEKLKLNLQYSIDRCEENFKVLQFRNEKLYELINILDDCKRIGVKEMDVVKIRDALLKLNENIYISSLKEIELNETLKVLQQKNHENVVLSSRYEKLKMRCDIFERKTNEMKQRFFQANDNLKDSNKFLHIEKNKNNESSRRVFNLEKRLSILNAKDHHLVDKDNYKNVIGELVRENEGLKRTIALKDKEIGRVNEKMMIVKAKYSNLYKKMDSLQFKMSGSFIESPIDLVKDPQFNLSFFQGLDIGRNLEWRMNNVSSRIMNSLINIMESPQNLFTHLSLNEDPYLKKELLLELAKQYVSFKEFSEKINLLHFEMLSLMQEENLPDFLSKANNKIADIFNANIARVWIYDVSGDFLFTYEDYQQIKLASSKGLIAKVLENKIGENKLREKTIFLGNLITETDPQKLFIDSAILKPVEDFSDSYRAIIEITSISVSTSLSSLDYEYFSLLLAHLLHHHFASLFFKLAKTTDLKEYSLIKEAIKDLIKFNKENEKFYRRVEEWGDKIFCVSNCCFGKVEGGRIIRFKDGKKLEFDMGLGVLGFVASSGRSSLINNIKDSKYYDSNIDINTLLSVFCFPVMAENIKKEKYCIGVFQVPIKDLRNVGKTGFIEENQINENLIKLSSLLCEILEAILQ